MMKRLTEDNCVLFLKEKVDGDVPTDAEHQPGTIVVYLMVRLRCS
jgi:hypothetical protein